MCFIRMQAITCSSVTLGYAWMLAVLPSVVASNDMHLCNNSALTAFLSYEIMLTCI